MTKRFTPLRTGLRRRAPHHTAPRRPLTLLVPVSFLVLALAPVGCEPPDPPPDDGNRPAPVPETAASLPHRATGTFEPTVTPRESGETPEGLTLGHASLAKRFHGDLEGSAEGAMLTALTPVEGSAGYVAIERVEGSLHGRRGTFLLQHSGLMDRGAQELTITVIPGSGTDGLEGLRGTMTIRIADGIYAYEMAYTLPAGG